MRSQVWRYMQVAVCLASLLLVSATLQAQQSTATVIGTVKDASGGVVPGATVTLRNLGTGAQSTVATGASGEYTIADLAVGQYSLSISKPGFETTTIANFQLQVGQSARMDATLEVGATTQKVTVSAASPLINTATSDVGQVVSREELENVPLNGRAFWQLAQLTPGALYTPGGSSPYTASSAVRSTSVTVSINSANTDMTGYVLDGADITEVQLGSTLVQPNVDAIQEFEVEGGNTDAQFGRSPSEVSAVIKSGTNQFHGDAFEFVRNDVFDARNTFYEPSPGNPYKKDILKRNQFGGTFGGPIKRNKAFFFADLEATRVRQAVVASSIVPSQAERQGNFSEELPTPLLNPYNGYQPFEGNVITPSSLIVSQAQFFNQYLPEPNLVQGTTSWFVAGTPLSINEYKGDAKVDENVTARDRLMARYSVNNYTKAQSDRYPTLGMLNDSSQGEDFTLAYTHTFSSHLLNVAQFGYYRMMFLFGAPLPGTNFSLPTEANYQGFDLQLFGGFPQIILGPYAGWDGAPSNNEPKRNHVRTYEYIDTVSYFTGKHDIKMGFQLYHDTVGFNNGGTTQGTFDFEGIYTGDAYADYLLGVPEDVSRDGGVPLQGFYDNDPSLFVQDNYRLTRNLTLNLGLRWDSTSFYNASRGQFASMNLATGQLIIPSNFDPTAQPISAQLVPLYKDRYVTSGSLGLPDSLMRPDRSFAPRVGFAWAPFGSDKWAVRAGYGIYHPFIENDLVNNRSVDPPIEAYEDYFNDSPPLAPTRTWANFFQGEPLAGTANPNPGQLCPGTNFSFLSCSTPSIWAGTYGSQSGQGVQEYNFTVQRQLTTKVSLSLAYVGNTSSHEGHADSPNDPAPGPGNIQPRRPLEQWGPTTYTRYNQTANYNSLQFSVVSRNWHGLTMLGNYTWSKCLDRGNDDSGWSTLMLPLEYGPCDNSRINASAISYDYQLPFGRGRAFLHNASGWVNQVLGGWEISGVLTLQSGLPYFVTLSGDVANTGVGGQVPNVIGAPIQPRTTSCWFYDSYNPACQALAPNAANFLALPAQYTYGNESRNSLFGPGLYEWDAAFLKRFPITESKSLEFRAEFFDLPNHSNLSNPDSTLDSSAAGTISSTALPDRQIEFALKFFF